MVCCFKMFHFDVSQGTEYDCVRKQNDKWSANKEPLSQKGSPVPMSLQFCQFY